MSWRFYDYRCTDCSHINESFEDRSAPPETIPCPNPTCQGEAERIFSCAKLGTNWGGDVSMGKSDERPHDGILDTRAIADGMPLKEWKAKRKEYWLKKDMDANKRELG